MFDMYGDSRENMFVMYGDYRENMFDMYGDSRENLLETLAVLFYVQSPPSVA